MQIDEKGMVYEGDNLADYFTWLGAAMPAMPAIPTTSAAPAASAISPPT